MKRRALPVYLHVPNLIDYLRVLLLFGGLWVALSHPILGCTCFIGNLLLDALDGHLARLLHQTSAFGAILDYTIDRISFASYAILLAAVYPQYMALFCMVVNFDLASHFFHLTVTYAQNKKSHKEVASRDPWILHLYYKKMVLGLACLTHDLFFIFLFLYHFFPSLGLGILLGITAIGVIFKTIVHVIQIARATTNLLAI